MEHIIVLLFCIFCAVGLAKIIDYSLTKQMKIFYGQVQVRDKAWSDLLGTYITNSEITRVWIEDHGDEKWIGISILFPDGTETCKKIKKENNTI